MLNVIIVGGVQAGKTTLLKLFKRAANKAGYAVSFDDNGEYQAPDAGKVRVHLKTETEDEMLVPSTTSCPTRVQMKLDRADLKAVFLAWELDRRAGHCLSQEETDNVPPGQAAEESTAAFLRYLYNNQKNTSDDCSTTRVRVAG